MRKYFKGVPEPAADGWLLAVVTGNSNLDEQTWIIDTNSLHADQVPNHCNDAKSFSLLVAGLLNFYYNNMESNGHSPEVIMAHGQVDDESETIPSPKNPVLPFPDGTEDKPF